MDFVNNEISLGFGCLDVWIIHLRLVMSSNYISSVYCSQLNQHQPIFEVETLVWWVEMFDSKRNSNNDYD